MVGGGEASLGLGSSRPAGRGGAGLGGLALCCGGGQSGCPSRECVVATHRLGRGIEAVKQEEGRRPLGGC